MRGGDYKQGIQCWGKHKQGFGSQVRNEQDKHSAHCSSQEFPARMQPNTALQSSLRKSSNHCNHQTTQFQHRVQQHATHNHSTRTAVPIRRIVSSSLKDKTQTLVPARVPGPVPRCAMLRQLNSHAQSCDEVRQLQDAKRSALRMDTRTHFVSPQMTFEPTSKQVPFSSARQVASIPPRQANRSSRSHQRVVTPRRRKQPRLRNQLKCAVLVTCVHTLFVPSLRTS